MSCVIMVTQKVPVLGVAFSNHGFTSMSPMRMRISYKTEHVTNQTWLIFETSWMAVLFFQGLSRCKFDFKIEKTSKMVFSMIYDDSATIWNEDEDDDTDEYHYCNYHYYNYHYTSTQLS